MLKRVHQRQPIKIRIGDSQSQNPNCSEPSLVPSSVHGTHFKHFAKIKDHPWDMSQGRSSSRTYWAWCVWWGRWAWVCPSSASRCTGRPAQFSASPRSSHCPGPGRSDAGQWTASHNRSGSTLSCLPLHTTSAVIHRSTNPCILFPEKRLNPGSIMGLSLWPHPSICPSLELGLH